MDPLTKEKPTSKIREKTKEPEQFNVILLNDNYTTMEFVVEILMKIFHKNTEEAFLIMLNIHNKGRGVVGAYTWDIAVTKAEQVHTEADANQFPLRCIIEPA